MGHPLPAETNLTPPASHRQPGTRCTPRFSLAEEPAGRSAALCVGGGGGGGGEATGITGRAGGGGAGGGGQGDAASFFGTQSVNLDPTMFGGLDWGHNSNPQASDFVIGSNVLVIEDSTAFLGVRQGFITGATASVTYANRHSDSSSINANLNPTNRSNLTLRIEQPLMRGFGKSVNTRNIRVARRNQEITDLAFKQQVIEVVGGCIRVLLVSPGTSSGQY